MAILRVRGVTVAALIIACAACGGGGSTQSLPSTTASTVNAGAVRRIVQEDLKAMYADLTSVKSAARASDLPAMRTACDKTRDDATKMTAHLDVVDIPIAARGHLQKSFTDLQMIGKRCAEGISAGNFDFLSSTLSLMRDALTEIDLANTALGSSPSPTVEITAPTTTTPQTPHVGETVSLPARALSPPMKLTLVKIIDPARQAGGYNDAEPGTRLVGVQIRLVLGDTPRVPEVPDVDTKVYDLQGRSYFVNGLPLADCPGFPIPLTTTPGLPVVGCVTFQLTTSAKVAKVTFTPLAGSGPVTAEWQVP